MTARIAALMIALATVPGLLVLAAAPVSAQFKSVGQPSKDPNAEKKKPVDDGTKRNTFEEYFSTESLFDWTGADDSIFDATDPYVVLGLPPSASWEEISSAHRRLAKLHHPDRQIGTTDEERENSDRRIRELNIAYMELRRRKGR